ncbi:unnamed protein product [Vitrella brassicaformis CCMP3155]|uniref:Uncharacterized protein n=1 Tax=Vitrella brassicaformis (strain CCMP3155) TaxID=1169540 RepID=A0A0G4EGH9_VITBC|nr:unnamed protein product [Vitrella brassicaformis CCMP3155]|eukprot:CEL94570.1 unnamed protein product [Vitrella brassicaformis CCMP3155]
MSAARLLHSGPQISPSLPPAAVRLFPHHTSRQLETLSLLLDQKKQEIHCPRSDAQPFAAIEAPAVRDGVSGELVKILEPSELVDEGRWKVDPTDGVRPVEQEEESVRAPMECNRIRTGNEPRKRAFDVMENFERLQRARCQRQKMAMRVAFAYAGVDYFKLRSLKRGEICYGTFPSWWYTQDWSQATNFWKNSEGRHVSRRFERAKGNRNVFMGPNTVQQGVTGPIFYRYPKGTNN